MSEQHQSFVDAEAIERGQPAWRVALLFPPQGSWTEADYLTLDAGRLVEFDQGCVEVLDMPTKEHQRIVQYVFRALFQHVDSRHLGEVFVAPLPVRLWEEKFREPDVLFVAKERDEYGEYPNGADLVVEVLSSDAASRRRDLVTKADEYARAAIAEYWVIDSESKSIRVGTLNNGEFDFTEYISGQQAISTRLVGFELDVHAVFATNG